MVKKDPIFYGIKGDYLLWIKRKLFAMHKKIKF